MSAFEPFEPIAQALRDALTPEDGWRALLAGLDEAVPGVATQLGTVDFAADLAVVSASLAEVLRLRPPRDEVDMLYFGLFDEVYGRRHQLGYYVQGYAGFGDRGEQVLEGRPAWGKTYLKSTVLDALKRAEVKRRGRRRQVLGYTGQLATALWLTRWATAGVPDRFAILVGFDSGDVVRV